MMKYRQYIYFLIFVIITIFELNAAVETFTVSIINDFEERMQALPRGKSVVFLDVDYTSVTPADLALRRPYEKQRQERIKEMAAGDEVEEKRLNSIWQSASTYVCVESETTQKVIERLQSSYFVIFVTNWGTGEYGEVKNRAELRVSQLGSSGINLGKGLEDFFAWEEEDIFFEGAVLFTNGKPKEDAIKLFVKKARMQGIQLTDLGYGDDERKNIDKAAEDSDLTDLMKCHLVHYDAQVFKEDSKVDERIADLQFETLRKEGKWLSDKEARNMLQGK